MTLSEAELLAWMQTGFLVFARCGGLLMTAPVLGARLVPVRIRVVLALLLTILLTPQLPALELQSFGARWWLLLGQQILLGAAMGFVLQLVFEAVTLGGELIAYGMGLSFAQLADPLRGASTPVVGHFLLLMATLLFLALHGHLILLDGLAESLRTQPPAAGGLDAQAMWTIATWGARVFAGAIQVALPVMIAMLLVNLSFGVLSRAAPSLNLIAVGFPVSLIAGLLLLQFGLPGLSIVLQDVLDSAWPLIAALSSL